MKHSILKGLSLGVAAGALAFCTPAAKADDAMPMTPTAMAAPTMTPMAVSGTVLRYYVDRSGYVTAMDVQAADGVKMVRFSPSMAQSLTSTYPVGSTASVYITSTMMGGMTRYDLAGMGATMPSPTAMMMPMTVSDVDVLKASPYIMLGSKLKMYSGKVTGYVTDPDSSEVLALILDGKNLLRVPRENRLVQASPAPEGVTPLFKGAYVAAYGYDEAPRYGSVSPFDVHIATTSMSVNGVPVGALGFGKIVSKGKNTLLGLNIGGGDATPEASMMGYSTYMAPAPTPTP